MYKTNNNHLSTSSRFNIVFRIQLNSIQCVQVNSTTQDSSYTLSTVDTQTSLLVHCTWLNRLLMLMLLSEVVWFEVTPIPIIFSFHFLFWFELSSLVFIDFFCFLSLIHSFILSYSLLLFGVCLWIYAAPFFYQRRCSCFSPFRSPCIPGFFPLSRSLMCSFVVCRMIECCLCFDMGLCWREDSNGRIHSWSSSKDSICHS